MLSKSKNTLRNSEERTGVFLINIDENDQRLPLIPEETAVLTRFPHATRSKGSTFLHVALFIIACEFCERLAYWSIAGSMVLFFQTQFHLSNADADTQFTLWSGGCFVFPLFGAWVADKKLGRYRTILFFCIIYLLGLCLVLVASTPQNMSLPVFYAAIYLVAFGTGGIKPNVSTFGAEQFNDDDPQDQAEKEVYFGWFYWSVNLGSFFSYAIVSFVCQFGISWLGGKKWGFFVGFSIPVVVMVFSIFLFVAGTPRYNSIHMPQNHSQHPVQLFHIVFEALWKRRYSKMAVKELGWIQRASVSFGGSYSTEEVEDAAQILKLIPFLVLTIFFWGTYQQINTSFQNQGCQMNLNVGTVKIPVAFLNIFDSLAIIVLVPFFNKVVYPFWKKCNMNPTALKKIGLGFFVASVAMVCAGVLETYRKKLAPSDGPYPIGKDNIDNCKNIEDFMPSRFQLYYNSPETNPRPQFCYQVNNCSALGTDNYLDLSCIHCENIPQISPISVLWQSFQFILIGTAEILTAIPGLEFFYSEAPLSMKSTFASLNYLTISLGTWLVIPLIAVANISKKSPWIPSDLNDGHLDKYFFLLAGLNILNLIIFVCVAGEYQYFAPIARLSSLNKDETCQRSRSVSETAVLSSLQH